MVYSGLFTCCVGKVSFFSAYGNSFLSLYFNCIVICVKNMYITVEGKNIQRHVSIPIHSLIDT